jgi:beta-mannosidase
MMEFSRQSLSTGWSFRDRDADEWMPVSVVPSVVQQDLIANNK